jgi:hypothetical protein
MIALMSFKRTFHLKSVYVCESSVDAIWLNEIDMAHAKRLS